LAAVAVALTAALGLAGCGQSAGQSAGESPASSTAGAGFPRTIDHAMGRTTIDRAPQRVAALDTSYVDAALALETQVVAYTRYPGYGDRFPDYLAADAAKYAKDAKPVGDLATPKVEELAQLAPDLIVSAKVRHEALYGQLQQIAPTVFSVTTGATWKDNIRLLAKALGREDLAERKISGYEARAKKIGDEIRAKVGHNPTVSLVRFVGGEATVRLYTPNSFPGIVLHDVGLARPDGQPSGSGISAAVSQEQITALDADRVFVATWNDGKGESQQLKDRFTANPLWSKLAGVRQDVSDTTWVGSVSLQGANAMLDDLAAAFAVDPAKN
jgi:iron complex transport system substrate-binding protein